MSFEEKTYSLIEKYLEGTLTPEEAVLVENLFQIDNMFADEVEAHRMANELVIDNALLDIQQELKDIHQKSENETKSKFNKRIYLSSIFLAGLIAAGLIMYNIRTADNQKADEVTERAPVKDLTLITPDTFAKNDLSEPTISIKSDDEKNTITDIREKSTQTTESASPQTDEKISPSVVTKNSSTKTIPSSANDRINNVEKANPNSFTNTTPTLNTLTECNEVTIQPDYSVDPNSGNLTIDTKLTKGNPPYQYSIDGGKTYSDQHEFKSEGRSSYLVIVKDQKNCKSEITELKIPTRVNYVIYPDKQLFLEISLSRFSGAPVDIKIMNARTGAIVYTAVTVTDATNFVWGGVDQSNNPLAMGSYVYEITSTRSSVALNGLITIVR